MGQEALPGGAVLVGLRGDDAHHRGLQILPPHRPQARQASRRRLPAVCSHNQAGAQPAAPVQPRRRPVRPRIGAVRVGRHTPRGQAQLLHRVLEVQCQCALPAAAALGRVVTQAGVQGCHQDTVLHHVPQQRAPHLLGGVGDTAC